MKLSGTFTVHLFFTYRASVVAQWWRVRLQCRKPGFHPWVGKMPWRRKWQPTPVFLPGKSYGQRNLAGYSPWGHKESDMSEHEHKLLTMWFDPFMWVVEDLENLKIATGSMYFIKHTALNDSISEHRFMKLALLCYIHQHVPKPAGVVIISSFTFIEWNQMLPAFHQLTSCSHFTELFLSLWLFSLGWDWIPRQIISNQHQCELQFGWIHFSRRSGGETNIELLHGQCCYWTGRSWTISDGIISGRPWALLPWPSDKIHPILFSFLHTCL